MTILVITVVIVTCCSLPCWLTWKQTMGNHVLLKDMRWNLDELRNLLIEREHEAGYVAGTSDERQIGAERAADLAAVAVTVAAEAVVAAHAANVYDADNNLVAHIKPVEEGEGGDPRAV